MIRAPDTALRGRFSVIASGEDRLDQAGNRVIPGFVEVQDDQLVLALLKPGGRAIERLLGPMLQKLELEEA